MDVSIIIVHYNTYDLTCNCIASVLQYTGGIDYEVILVDNGSTDDEIVSFEEKFPSIRVIRLKENLGFSKGNNAGIQYACGNYILLLNSDTVLKENSIKLTYNYLKRNPKVGVASARLLFPDGTHQSIAQRFPSIRYQLVELLRIQKLLPAGKRGRLLLGSFFNHQCTVKVDWVWGAFFMFPQKILKLLPGEKLNDQFFMYIEDMQWCKDISRLGYEIHFFAGTEVVHLMGGSSGPKKEQMEKNINTFLESNYSPVHRFFIKLIHKVLVSQ